MEDQFEMAAGSVIGTEHLRTSKNNQDAFYSLRQPMVTVAVVCDGCGSSAHSEVGAKLGARWIAEAIAQRLDAGQDLSEPFWWGVQRSVLAQLRALVERFGGDRPQVVQDYLLFTVVGAVVTPTETQVFGLGDGAIAVNGHLQHLGPFPNNAPPYLAYGLLVPDTARSPILDLQIHHSLATEDVQSILIGTDGLEDFCRAADQPGPDPSTPLGPLSQFWQDDRYFRNPDAVRRQLTRLNHQRTTADWQAQQLTKSGGLLRDDTTLIVLRKRSPST